MARISEILLLNEIEHYTITKRKKIDFMNEYADFMEKTLKEIDEYLKNNNLFRCSAPMVCFHNMDLENLDIEIGYHIESNIGCIDFKIKKVHTKTVIETIDLGAYEQQDPTLMDMFKWIEDNNYSMNGEIYYYYLNDPNRPESQYLTKMVIPINR